MFNGFIKTAAVTPRMIVGDVDYNVSEIIDNMYKASDEGVRILVFPELCITGSTCGDLFRQDRLIEAAQYGLQDILDASTDLDMLVFVGLPWRKDGKLYNVTAAVKSGTLLGLVPKVYPETSTDSDESRWFESGQEVPELITTELMYGIAPLFDEEEDECDDDGSGPVLVEDEDNELSDDPLEIDPEYFKDWKDVSDFDDDDDDDDDDDVDDDDDDDDNSRFEQIEVSFGHNLIFECTDAEGLGIAVMSGDEYRMAFSPAASVASAGACIIVNPCAHTAEAGGLRDAENDLEPVSRQLFCAIVRAGAGIDESSTDFVYDGCRHIVENGETIASAKALTNGMLITDIHYAALEALRRNSRIFASLDEEEADVCYDYIGFMYADLSDTPLDRKIEANPFVPKSRMKSICRDVFDIQAAALARRMRHTGSRKMILGLSGGLDSAQALLVSIQAASLLGLPSSSVLCLSMPAFGTSERTHDNSEALAKALGADFREIDLKASLLQHFADIGHPVDVHDAAYENAQARERTQILMDIANMENGIVVGTGDMSEAALGWCTFNGDQMSMYNVNAGVPKSVIRLTVRYAADTADDPKLHDVLKDILDTPVSPELLPADAEGGITQVTEDLVGPYELHDFFLYYMLKYGFAPDRLAWLAGQAFAGKYSRKEILHWLTIFCKRFFASQFKRSCAVDAPKVFDISLSPRGGLNMPSDASSILWTRDLEILSMIEEQYGEDQ